MKFFVSILLTVTLAFAAGFFAGLPWFSFAITTFLVAVFVHQKPGKAFLSGFLSIFLLWLVLALLKDIPNAHLLSTKVARVLPLNGSYIAILLLTSIIGALVGGLAALTGSYLRKTK